ncbi:ATP-binding protein [Hyphomonas adhaerens]|uniref:ATP-binding protein n=1 Tax=Hyphomonas adhaerens TaxID=81029 RepID=UPI002357BBA8|nr:ATP-binding protein [Hyphomonas adhaerens]
MDPVRNPFAPGAGTQPPELAGRDTIIEAARIASMRILQGRYDKSQILLGLRGTGKTVLLNKIEQIASDAGLMTSFIEAPEGQSLAQLLYPKLYQVLRRLSVLDSAKKAAREGMRALRNFAAIFKVKLGEVTIEVEAESGIADSGNLEFDLIDVFVRIGKAAQAAGKGWALLIDELQYLSEKELAALIVAIHRVNQLRLPIIFFGAGLPQIAALSGEAKSYAERLFDYPPIGALAPPAARMAIRQPIEDEEETIDDDALNLIVQQTEGYPYFLQEWGFQSWNAATTSPITIDDVEIASMNATQRLDNGFFRVRLDRLTPKEKEYVIAMASLGKGPYRSADVADKLGEKIQSLGPRRAQIISKGMIYSPAHGDIDFTVPMFDDFLRRNYSSS